MSIVTLIPASEGTPDSSNSVNIQTNVESVIIDLTITEQPIPVDQNSPYTALAVDVSGVEDKSLLQYDMARSKWVPTRTLENHNINGGQY